MRVLAWIGRALALLLVLLLLGLAWLWWSNRDLPVEVLEARYGGDNLQVANILGVPLRYKVEGSGPPVVLLHSHFYTMRMWQPWVEALREDYTVIRYDLTSHGLTGPDPSEDYSRQRGTDLLDGLLQHLAIERASIVGSSTGGALAWYYAARFPDKVDALVLINAPGMPRVTNKYMERELPSWFGHLLYLLPRNLFRGFLEAPIIDDSLVTDELLTEFHEMYRREGNRMGEFHRLLAWERGDIRPTLSRITAPTLVLWGEENPQLPVEHVALYEEALVNAPAHRSVIYPGVGHVIPIEAPAASVRDTRAFLEEFVQ